MGRAKKWNKQLVIKIIKKFYSSGKSLRSSFLKKKGKRYSKLVEAGRKHFRTWENAINAAGFDYNHIRGRIPWTKESVLEEIKNLNKLGTRLTGGYLRKQNRKYANLVEAGYRYFGNWAAAIEAAGIDCEQAKVYRQGEWNKQKVIDEIRKLESKGVSLNKKIIQGIKPSLHYWAGIFFGSWARAIYASGIDYAKYLQIWSSNAWLKKLGSKDVNELEKKVIKMSKERRAKR